MTARDRIRAGLDNDPPHAATHDIRHLLDIADAAQAVRDLQRVYFATRTQAALTDARRAESAAAQAVRDLQRVYFATRTQAALTDARRAESALDKLLKLP